MVADVAFSEVAAPSTSPGDKGLKTGALGFVSSVVIGTSPVIVGTVGENPITGALLGSVVLRLVQRSPLPVLVVPTAEV